MWLKIMFEENTKNKKVKKIIHEVQKKNKGKQENNCKKLLMFPSSSV